MGVAPRKLRDFKNHKAIVYQDPVSHVQVAHQAPVVDADPGLVPLHLVGGKGKGVSLLHLNFSRFESTDTVLRSLGIQHDADGQVQLLANLFNEVDLLFMLCVGAVGEIQPGNVHTCQTQLFQGLLVLAGGADGADDLRLAHGGASLYLKSLSGVYWTDM